MEKKLMKGSDHHHAVKKEKRADSSSSSGDEEAAAATTSREEVAKVGNKRPYRENDDMKPSSPGHKDLSSIKQVLL
ncbi:putative WRKY transcription factor [Corchorus olitorius]|uniref:WRKY transcription factor n=1 Tax=Corchorus olitorius TaxID=93759 RepID=A0A1R3L3V3_9ROSI|nr:putative WRKY transcription factor [Corchorus olitorius]